MKVTYLVTRADTIGGSHIHVRDMALALQKDGHRADIIMGGPGPVVDHYRKHGLNPVVIQSLKRNISPFYDFSAYRKIKQELKKLDPDIVSAHSSKAGFLGRLAACKMGYPVLFTAHGWSFTTGKKGIKTSLFKALEKWIAPKTDKIITVSDYDRNLALEHLDVPEQKIQTVHNGMGDIENKFRADPGSGSPVNIVMIARFDKQKDHAELLEAVRDINNIYVHFVGDGPLLEQTKQKVRQFGMYQNIKFWGRLDRVDEVLSKGQIFALISNWEGFPRSTLEAMRAGLPTIVSDVGGSAEAVLHDETGYVVKKGDVETLSKYVQKLVQDKKLRSEMGKNARKRYKNYFTFDAMYEKTLGIYNDLLISKKQRGL